MTHFKKITSTSFNKADTHLVELLVAQLSFLN